MSKQNATFQAAAVGCDDRCFTVANGARRTMQERAKLLHTIDPSLSLLYYVIAGSVELNDFFVYERVAWRDPLRRPGMKIIVDLSLVSAISYELADIQRMIDLNVNLLAQGLPLEPTAIIGRKAAHWYHPGGQP